MARRIGGVIFVKADGVQFDVKGEWTYNLGQNKRDEVMGMDGLHGYKETPQPAMLEGKITDNADLDLINDLLNLTDATITLQAANGKTIVFSEAFYADEGNVTTDEGEVGCKFVSGSAAEVAA